MSENDPLDTIRQARQRLTEQELVDRDAQTPRGGSTPGAPNPKDDKVLMYRGRVIRGGGGGAPGAPSGGRPPQRRKTGGGGGGNSEVKAKLQQLSDLFDDGLLTKAEYDAKRAQVISQL